MSTYEDHLLSADGHPIISTHSTFKSRRDATHQRTNIAKAIAAIDAFTVRLAAPRCPIKTAVAVQTEAHYFIAEVNATR